MKKLKDPKYKEKVIDIDILLTEDLKRMKSIDKVTPPDAIIAQEDQVLSEAVGEKEDSDVAVEIESVVDVADDDISLHSTASVRNQQQQSVKNNKAIDMDIRPLTAEQQAIELTKQEEYQHQLKPCGSLQLSRIVDLKKIDSVPDGIHLSDDKINRFLNKNTTHLGKWSIHSAVRMDDSHSIQEYFCQHHHSHHNQTMISVSNKNNSLDIIDSIGAKGSSGNDSNTGRTDDQNNNGNVPVTSLKELIKSHVISLTPIVIQQDNYCLSTATPLEYTTWPPDSSFVINHFQGISTDQAEELDDEYETFLKSNGGNLDILNLPTIYGKTVKDSGIKIKRLKTINANVANGSTTKKKQHNKDNKTPSHSNGMKGVFKGSKVGVNTVSSPMKSGSVKADNDKKDYDYCCLRRIISRGTPYQFAIDRRSVWKLCLFEEFSSSSTSVMSTIQSKKENEVKKIMQTANMVLKLSQMNREGAKLHLKENMIEHLPSLRSGEKFISSLRQIRLKKLITKDHLTLAITRSNESSIHDYFGDRITNVLENEKSGFRKSLTTLRSSSTLFKSKSYSSLSVDPTNKDNNINGEYRKREPSISLLALQENEDDNDGESSVVSQLSNASYLSAGSIEEEPSQIFALSSIESNVDCYSLNTNGTSMKKKKKISFPLEQPEEQVTSFVVSQPTRRKRQTTRASLVIPITTASPKPTSTHPLQFNDPYHSNRKTSIANCGVPFPDLHYPRLIEVLTPTENKMKSDRERNNSMRSNSINNQNATHAVNALQHRQHRSSSLTVDTGLATKERMQGDDEDDDNSSIVSMLSMATYDENGHSAMNSPVIGESSTSHSSFIPRNRQNEDDFSLSSLKHYPPAKNNSGTSSLSVNVTRNRFSKDAKTTFNTNILYPNEKKLLLVNSSAVSEFPSNLSTGEQVLSYHKTMNYLTKAAKVSFFFVFCLVSSFTDLLIFSVFLFLFSTFLFSSIMLIIILKWNRLVHCQDKKRWLLQL
jgi:hypothetical protein